MNRQALVALIHRLEDSYYEGTHPTKGKQTNPEDNPYYPLPHPYFSLADLQQEEDQEDDDWQFID